MHIRNLLTSAIKSAIPNIFCLKYFNLTISYEFQVSSPSLAKPTLAFPSIVFLFQMLLYDARWVLDPILTQSGLERLSESSFTWNHGEIVSESSHRLNGGSFQIICVIGGIQQLRKIDLSWNIHGQNITQDGQYVSHFNFNDNDCRSSCCCVCDRAGLADSECEK